MKEFIVYLQKEQSIVSVFAHSASSDHNRVSNIWIGNDNASMIKSSLDMNDSGFFFIKPPLSVVQNEIVPVRGTQVSIRRSTYNSIPSGK